MIIKLLRAAVLLICASSAPTAIASEFPVPLPADSTLKVESLPAKYPTGWAFLNYAGDRIELRNVGSDRDRYPSLPGDSGRCRPFRC